MYNQEDVLGVSEKEGCLPLMSIFMEPLDIRVSTFQRNKQFKMLSAGSFASA